MWTAACSDERDKASSLPYAALAGITMQEGIWAGITMQESQCRKASGQESQYRNHNAGITVQESIWAGHV